LPAPSPFAVRCLGVGVSAPLPKQASPSGINPRLLAATIHHFRGFRSPAVPNRLVCTVDLHGVGCASGFRRQAGLPPSLFRFYPDRGLGFPGRPALLHSVPIVFTDGGFRSLGSDSPPWDSRESQHFRFRRPRSLSLPLSADCLKPMKRRTASRIGTALRLRFLRTSTEQETLRSSPAGLLALLRFAARRFLSESPSGPQQGGHQPSSIHGVGCPISPTSRSEFASR